MICQDKARRRPLSGQGADDIQAQAQFDMPGQSAAPIQDGLLGGGGIQLARTKRGAGADDIQAQAQFDMPGQSRGAGGYQAQAQMIFRTKRGAGRFQDKAQMIFRTKRGAGRFQDGLSGGFSRPGQAGADDIQDKTRRRPLSGRLIGGIQPARTRRRR